MKRASIVTGVAAAAALLGLVVWMNRPGAATAYGQEAKGDAAKEDPHVISVSGSATVRVTPDSARLFFTVVSYAEQIRAARTDNAGKVQKLMKALADLKVSDLKSKSDDLKVEQLVDRDDGRALPRVIGYRVTNSFTVLVENADRVRLSADASRVLDTVLENGGTGISQIVFFKKGVAAEQLRRQAMTKAVEDALANARALLAGMKRDKLEPLSVSATPRYREDPLSSANATTIQAWVPGANEGVSTALVAGDLQFQCDVTLTCRY
jgi:uncharacterized protein YggE